MRGVKVQDMRGIWGIKGFGLGGSVGIDVGFGKYIGYGNGYGVRLFHSNHILFNIDNRSLDNVDDVIDSNSNVDLKTDDLATIFYSNLILKHSDNNNNTLGSGINMINFYLSIRNFVNNKSK